MRDGKIVCAIGEERLSKRKGEFGFPFQAVRWVMEYAGVVPSEVDALCLALRTPTIALMTPESEFSLGGSAWFFKLLPLIKECRDWILYAVPVTGKWYDFLYRAFYLRLFEKKLRTILLNDIKQKTGIASEKVMLIDEHEYAHAYAVYYGMRGAGVRDEEWLTLTTSGFGDRVCAVVGQFKDDKLDVIAETPNGASLGVYFSETTLYFGMRLNEHEYKIMGLAPYAEKRGEQLVYDRLKNIVQVDGMRYRSRWFIDTFVLYPYFRKQLEKCRFDWIAGGVQKIVEDKLCEWVRNIIRETGKNKFFVSGGVFMNIKAIKTIIELPEVADLVVVPTASDESTCFGAGYYAYRELARHRGMPFAPLRLPDMYLGPSYTDDEVHRAIGRELSPEECDVEQPAVIEDTIARLLANNEIVARFAGRMEFGARALGNRSILANPSRLEGITVLNDQIKSRDFWMPFACTVLKERAGDYIVNPKGIQSPFMAIAFDTTRKGAAELQAGLHPYDKTIRPQILEEADNPSYYRVIKAFERLTGIGGVLNTSFNIHGEPIVCSPEDAISAFKRSGLKYLAIGSYLITKRG